VRSGESTQYTIVGIVGTVRHDDPGELPKFAQLYLPVSQRPDLQMTILFQTDKRSVNAPSDG